MSFGGIVVGFIIGVFFLAVLAILKNLRNAAKGCGQHHFGEWRPVPGSAAWRVERTLKTDDGDAVVKLERKHQATCQHAGCKIADKEWKTWGWAKAPAGMSKAQAWGKPLPDGEYDWP